MALQLDQLDDRTRRLMLEEVQRDEHANRLYLSPRLSAQSQTDYPVVLQQAVQQRNDDWLAHQLGTADRLDRTEMRNRQGKTHVASVPDTAPAWVAMNHSKIAPSFRGRAAAPVYVRVANHGLQELGAVCLDVEVPWHLSEWDKRLMQIFAQRIGSLWGSLTDYVPAG